jgi:F-box protein 11
VLAERQYEDWRPLRFEPMTSPAVRQRIAALAERIRVVLADVAESTPSAAEGSEQAETADAVRTEPPTLVVDQYGRADHTTITAAIKAAAPGSRIVVRPGLYEESLVVDKALEIIGQGDREDIVVQAHGNQNIVRFAANIGRIANLTLRHDGTGNWVGVDIAQGRLELEDCDISGASNACVVIRDGADPRLRRNTIHDSKKCGVFVYDQGLGTLEDNDVHSNAYAGVEIKNGGNPTLRRNTIHDGKAGGLFVYRGGLGTVEDNDIHSNVYAGVEIKNGGNPTLRRNTIHDGKTGGVYVHDGGLGTVEDNDIHSNGLSGITIKTSSPTVRRNRIRDNARYGIEGGNYPDNEFSGNARGDVPED